MSFLKSLYRFSRFHTVIGTTLSVVILYIIASSLGNENYSQNLSLLAWTLVTCLGANIYIVGLNQILDIEIDIVNKPYLPLASGEYTLKTAYWIISISVLISIVVAILLGKYMMWTVGISLFLGTIYSAPPLRLKQYYFWAAFCIIAIRGLVVNILIFLHFNYHINASQQLPIIILLLTGIIFMYSVIIAWYKDMPDTEGDSKYQIETLSIKLGIKTVMYAGLWIMGLSYLVLVTIAHFWAPAISSIYMLVGHVLLFAYLIYSFYRTDIRSNTSVRKFYLSFWVLFFAEYLVFGLVSVIS